MNKTIEKIVSLCKQRGFVYQSSEIYGGFGAVYDSRAYMYGWTNGSNALYPSDAGRVTYGNNDIIGCAVDMDNYKFYFSKNGTFLDNSNPVTGANPVDPTGSNKDSDGTYVVGDVMFPYFSGASGGTGDANFGQRPFAYTPPAGYRALNSRNIATPVPAGVVRPQRYFDTVLFTGNGGTQNITGLEFKPDFVWIKTRSTSNYHFLFDSVRGVNKFLFSNATSVENGGGANPETSLTSFNSNGFSLGADPTPSTSTGFNKNGATHVAWCWKAGGNSDTFNIDGVGYGTAAAAGLNGGTANPTGASVNTKKGFSIVTYTGTNNQNVSYSHGLNQAPEMIITKRRDSANNWGVYYTANGTNTNWMTLNTTDAQGSNNSGTTPVGGSSGTFMYLHQDYFAPSYNSFANGGNDGSSNMVAYMWHSVPGYSKFGKYKGNGTTNGAFINLGFRPAWVMIKQTNSTAGWMIYDSERSPSNQINKYFQANSSNAEVDSTTDNPIDFLSNGMKMRYNNTATNQNNGTYIYMAFAEQPGLTPYDTQTNAR